jgi:hypothetical protein
MGIVRGDYPDSIGTATCEPLADNSSLRTDRFEAQSGMAASGRTRKFSMTNPFHRAGCQRPIDASPSSQVASS